MKKKHKISAYIRGTNSDGYEKFYIIQTLIREDAKHSQILSTRLNYFHFDLQTITKINWEWYDTVLCFEVKPIGFDFYVTLTSTLERTEADFGSSTNL